jgi:hypothetical protein
MATELDSILAELASLTTSLPNEDLIKVARILQAWTEVHKVGT